MRTLLLLCSLASVLAFNTQKNPAASGGLFKQHQKSVKKDQSVVLIPNQKQSTTALQVVDVASVIAPGLIFFAAAAASANPEAVTASLESKISESSEEPAPAAVEEPIVVPAKPAKDVDASVVGSYKAVASSSSGKKEVKKSDASSSVLQKTLNLFLAILRKLFSPVTAIFRSG